MEIDLRGVFAAARKRPGMYVMPEPWHARTVVPWMIGCDMATSHELLGQGFSVWLNKRAGGRGRSSLTWCGELMQATFPHRSDAYWELSQEDSDQFLDALFVAVDKYLAEKGAAFDVRRAMRLGNA